MPERTIALPSLASHGALHVLCSVGQVGSQIDQLAVFVYVQSIFDPHPQLFFRDVDAGLDGKHHARRQGNAVIAGIVDIQADDMID